MTVKLKRIKLYYMYELGHPMYSPVQSEMKSAIDRIVGHMKESHGVEAVQVKLLGLEEAFDVYVYEMKNHPVASLSYAMKADEKEANPWLELLRWALGMSDHTLPICTSSCPSSRSSPRTRTTPCSSAVSSWPSG